MSYLEKLKDPRWQKKRLEIFNRDGFSCTMCKSNTNTLHVHHEKYFGDPWDCPSENLKTYCQLCHSIIEYFKKVNKSAAVVHIKHTHTLDNGVMVVYCILESSRMRGSLLICIVENHPILNTTEMICHLDSSFIEDLSNTVKEIKGVHNV